MSHVALLLYQGRELDIVTPGRDRRPLPGHPRGPRPPGPGHRAARGGRPGRPGARAQPPPLPDARGRACGRWPPATRPLLVPAFFWKLLALEGVAARCSTQCAALRRRRRPGRLRPGRGRRAVPRPAGGACRSSPDASPWCAGSSAATWRGARRARRAGHPRGRPPRHPRHRAPPRAPPARRRTCLGPVPDRAGPVMPDSPCHDPQLMDEDRQPLQAAGLRVPVGARSTAASARPTTTGPSACSCCATSRTRGGGRWCSCATTSSASTPSILSPPAVWEASGHLANFTDPLVDCRNCKERFRRGPARRPAHVPELRRQGHASPRPAQFNLMFKTHVGPVEDDGAVAYLRPETAQGMFVNFMNVLQTTPQEAAVRHRPDRQVVPQRDHAGQLRVPHPRVRADGDGVLRAARRRARSGSSTGARSACAGTSTSASPRTSCACAPTTPTS